MSEFTINIAKDFSAFPAGRYLSHGKYTGEGFRKEHLLPALKDYEKVIVNFDGGKGYGSSFLDEAFAGLIRSEGYTRQQLENKLELVSSSPSLVQESWQYIREAAEYKEAHG